MYNTTTYINSVVHTTKKRAGFSQKKTFLKSNFFLREKKKMTTPQQPQSALIELTLDKTLIDYSDVSECKDISAIKRGVSSLIRAADMAADTKTQHNTAMKTVLIMAPTKSFSSGAETYGYYASTNASSVMTPDLLHTDKELGVIAAVRIDLKESKYWNDQTNELHTDAAKELAWACYVDSDKVAAASHSVVSTPGEFLDSKPWRSGLTGVGSWAGIFGCTKDGSRNQGILVVCIRSPHDPEMTENFRHMYQSSGGAAPTYAQHVLSERVERVASLQKRNACRIIYMALVALGMSKKAMAIGMKDARASASEENTQRPATGNDRWAILNSVMRTPYVVIPDIVNMLDVMEIDGDRVSLMDGVISVGKSDGGLIAVEGGDAAKGVYVVPIKSHVSNSQMEHRKRYFDGGHNCIASGNWKFPEELKSVSDYFCPLQVVKVTQ